MDTVGCDGKERFMTQQQVIIVRQEKSMAAAYVLLVITSYSIHYTKLYELDAGAASDRLR